MFMGSPAFAVPSLRALVAAGYNVVAVMSQPDRPAGRGAKVHAPEVKVAAVELGIDVFQPETLRDEAVRERMAGFEADVFVVAAYGKILPRAVLAMPRRGCLNVHASLLPRWRGASPINAAILAGDAESGVSIMELESKMDAGPVIARSAIPIAADDTAGTLEPRLAELGARTLLDVLPRWYDREIAAAPQDESLVTYCSLLKKEDGHLKSAMSVAEAQRAVRAYNPWPGAFVRYRDERLAIWSAHVAGLPAAASPGSLSIVEKRPAVTFAGGLLVLDEVQRAGSRRVPGQQFLNGERGELPAAIGLA
jgi:methionyl-tRNA formyltransferase